MLLVILDSHWARLLLYTFHALSLSLFFDCNLLSHSTASDTRSPVSSPLSIRLPLVMRVLKGYWHRYYPRRSPTPQPFRQGALSSGQHQDGVGLYIVQRILNILEGTISVESERGKGSTCRVWMPQG
ncbi:MAG: ATP-binding protein [Candidatus Binatia bacterium]